MSRYKNFLIRILFRLIDVEDVEVDNKHMKRWLADTWGDRGFIKYFNVRNTEFIKELSGGLGMKELPRDEYVRIIGQRFELLSFAQKAKSESIKREKERKGKE